MKKLLALVLALVMTLSLCTISNAAYSDAADIDYKEAVDVMSAIGVLEGSDGKFDPDAQLTRAQAAKIIAYLELGNKVASALEGSGKVFSDVPASHWACGYIEYLNSIGVVGGVGGGKFDPNGALTNAAFAKMLLVVLGCEADPDGLTGESWIVKTAKLANQSKIFDGADVGINATATRQQAALFAFNAITKGGKYHGASTGTQINVNGTKVSTNMIASTWTSYDNGFVGSYADVNYTKLEKGVSTSTDNFGRPATVWTYDGESVGTYASTADKVIVVNQPSTAKNYAKILEDNNLEAAAGAKFCDKSFAVNDNRNFDDIKTAIPATSSVLEIFKNDAGKVEKVVYYQYKLTEVKKVTTLKASDDLAKKGATVKYTLDGLAALTYVDTLDKTVASTQKIGTWAKGDMLAVVVDASGKLISVAKAAEVQGACSAYTSSSYTVDGTKYTFGATYTDANGINQSVDFKKGEYKLYLDANNYIIGSKTISGVATANAEDLVYVVATETRGTNNSGDDVYFVKAVNLGTGEYSVIQTEVNPLGGTTLSAGTVYLISTNSDDQTVFAAAADDTKLTDTVGHINNDSKEYFASAALADNTPVKADTKYLTVAGGQKAYLTDATMFVFEKGTKTTAVTGSVVKALEAAKTTVLVAKDSDNNYIAKVVVVKDTKYVETVDANTIYVKGGAYTGVNANGHEYTAYNLDGEKVTITLNQTADTTAGFYKYTVDADGVYTLEAVDAGTSNGNGKYTFSTKKASKFGNNLTIASTFEDVTMADDMVIVDLTTAEDIDTVSDLCDKTNVTGHALVMDKTVKVIVVTAAV